MAAYICIGDAIPHPRRGQVQAQEQKMAITMMCDPAVPGAVRDDYWSGVAKTDIWRVTTHEGLVLELREMNGYDDSDFYAVVWNDAKGEPERVEYASTRGWTYP